MATTKGKTATRAPAKTTPKEPPVQKTVAVRRSGPFEEMDRLFENLSPRGWLRPFHGGWPSWGELMPTFEGKFPRIDIIDRDTEIIVRAEVTGVEKKDLDVSMADDSVTIKGCTQHEEKEEKGDYYRCEISRGVFSRTVSLPSTVDSAKAKATFKDGVLELALPKVEKSKRRSITVE